jgi:hypothetical protein
MIYTRKALLSAAMVGALSLAGCGGPPPVTGGPPPIDFATFKNLLDQAVLLECGFVPAEAMIISIFNAGAGAGFKTFADEICGVVTSKAVRVGAVQPAILVNGVRIPVVGTFAR